MTEKQKKRIQAFLESLEYVFRDSEVSHTTMHCEGDTVIFIRVSGYGNPMILTVKDKETTLRLPHTEYKDKSKDITTAFVEAGL